MYVGMEPGNEVLEARCWMHARHVTSRYSASAAARGLLYGKSRPDHFRNVAAPVSQYKIGTVTALASVALMTFCTALITVMKVAVLLALAALLSPILAQETVSSDAAVKLGMEVYLEFLNKTGTGKLIIVRWVAM